jgi:flagellar biosynthesis/type III secretory pathway protein FliH
MLAENVESWTDQWKREGLAQGREQGLEQGREPARHILLRHVRRRFSRAIADQSTS